MSHLPLPATDLVLPRIGLGTDVHRLVEGTPMHLAGLVADTYVGFGWVEILVPMASTWKPGAVAFGIVGMYLLVAVEVSSLAKRRLPHELWRWIHRSSFILYVAATYHGIASGTDHSNQWFRLAALASVNVVMFLSVVAALKARRAKVARAASRAELVDA